MVESKCIIHHLISVSAVEVYDSWNFLLFRLSSNLSMLVGRFVNSGLPEQCSL